MNTFTIATAALLISASWYASGSARAQNVIPPSAGDHAAVSARGRNVDADTAAAQKQSAVPADGEITQRIRQAIVGDDSLSTTAKDVKVITIDGVVTLRGPVANDQEKNAVAAKANVVLGVKRLDNQLEATAR